jgi:glycosyltransferase involved in cell wall biosynthesis
MAEKGKDVDAFIAVSDYFAGKMKSVMKIPDEKMFIVPIGIEPELYKYSEPSMSPPVIGYISRMYEEHGFGLLIDAFIKLKQQKGFENVLLKLSGGYTADDKKFVTKQVKKLKKAKVIDDVEFIDDYKTEERYNFFEKVTILTVPVLKGEAFGVYQLESMACGVPLVQPKLGAFPEIIEQTKGGVTFEPNTPDAMVEAWMNILPDHELIRTLSKEGHKNTINKYHIDNVSVKVLEIYKKVVNDS